LLLSVGLLACGGGNSTDAGTPDSGTPDAGSASTITLAGARNSSLAASAPIAVWTPSTNKGEVTLTADGALEHTSFDFFFTGAPAVNSYAGTDTSVSCNVMVYLPAPSLDGWMANHNNGLMVELGTCTLTLSSVAFAVDNGTQKGYLVHGGGAATLPARAGNATGTVTYAVTF
jgi:hypothetical protein